VAVVIKNFLTKYLDNSLVNANKEIIKLEVYETLIYMQHSHFFTLYSCDIRKIVSPMPRIDNIRKWFIL